MVAGESNRHLNLGSPGMHKHLHKGEPVSPTGVVNEVCAV
jgi:hypothetical protein